MPLFGGALKQAPKVVRPIAASGICLRMRWLWHQRTDPNRPWSLLPERHEEIVHAMSQASISVQVGSGLRTFFWTDRWIQGRSIAEIAPALLAAVRPAARKRRAVAQGLQLRTWVRDITAALTVQVLIEYLQI